MNALVFVLIGSLMPLAARAQIDWGLPDINPLVLWIMISIFIIPFILPGFFLSLLITGLIQKYKEISIFKFLLLLFVHIVIADSVFFTNLFGVGNIAFVRNSPSIFDDFLGSLLYWGPFNILSVVVFLFIYYGAPKIKKLFSGSL